MVRRSHRRSRLIWLCAAALSAALAIGAPAQAENAFTKGGSQAFDLVLVRPLGAGRLLFGAVLFVPAALLAELPWKWNSSSSAIPEVWDVFVGEPFRTTFLMPLGEFEEEY